MFKIVVEIFVENSIFIGQLFFTYSVVRNKKYLKKITCSNVSSLFAIVLTAMHSEKKNNISESREISALRKSLIIALKFHYCARREF